MVSDTEAAITRVMDGYEVPVRRLPVLAWTRNGASHTWDCATCKKDGAVPADRNVIRVGSMGSTCIFGYYMEYLEELDAVVIGRASLDVGQVTKSNESRPRQWKRWGEIVVDGARNVYVQEKYDAFVRGTHERIPADGWFHIYTGRDRAGNYARLPFSLRELDPSRGEMTATRGYGVDGNLYEEFSKPLLKLFPAVVSMGANRFADITKSATDLDAFLRSADPGKKSGPKQKRIDAMTAVPLKNVAYDPDCPDRVATLERAGEGTCVLRTLFRDDTTATMAECGRIYAEKTRVTCTKPNLRGEWVPMALSTTPESWDFKLLEFDPKVAEGTRLGYFSEVVSEVPEEVRGKLMWAMLANQGVEMLAKAGALPAVIHEMWTIEHGKASDIMSSDFGTLAKAGGLYKRLGMNRHQAEAAIKAANTYAEEDEKQPGGCRRGAFSTYDSAGGSWWCSRKSPIAALKAIFADSPDRWIRRGTTYPLYALECPFVDISWMDDAAFDALFALVNEAAARTPDNGEYERRFGECLWLVRRLYCEEHGDGGKVKTDTALLVAAAENLAAALREAEDVGERPYTVFMWYRDYLRMAEGIRDAGERLLPCFVQGDSPCRTMREMHDAAVELHNVTLQRGRDRLKAERMKEALRARKDLEYEGKEFLIRCPETAGDLVEEGMRLHHCVGTYVSRVQSGATNIVFLRRKSDPDVPYFTVEVSNDGRIEQVHGVCNHNLDHGSPEEAFVREWAKKKRLRETDWDKVR